MKKFSLAKYLELSDKLNYNSVVCSDGLCCFLKKQSAKDFSLEQNPSMSLIRTRDRSFKYLVDLMKREPNKRNACRHLTLKTNVENEKLSLEFRCSIYNRRPDICEEYPTEDKCIYSLFTRLHPTEHLFLSFSVDMFPQMEEFAYETTGGILRPRRFLIPLPKTIH
jgi:Fe-S-cluster containining protein